MTLFDIIDTQGRDCRSALAVENADYEDAIMISSAQREEIDCIVTRNSPHFETSGITVYSPTELIANFDTIVR